PPGGPGGAGAVVRSDGDPPRLGIVVQRAVLPRSAANKSTFGGASEDARLRGREPQMSLQIVLHEGPPGEQIKAQIRGFIATNELPAGTRLPSVRQLARDLGIA